MERNELTPKQSLEVIEQMIQATSKRVSTHGAKQFLIWGYTTVLTSLLIYFIESYIGSSWYIGLWYIGYLWLLIPLVGGLLTWIDARRRTQVVYTRSHLDHTMHTVWSLVGVNTLLCGLILGLFSLPAVTLLITLGTAITGFVLRIRIIKVCSIVGGLLFYATIFVDLVLGYQIYNRAGELITALIFFIINCIPGHYLYMESRKAIKQHIDKPSV